MAAYAVDDLTYGPATLALCAAWVETQLETYDDAKTIRLVEINPISRDRDLCVAAIIIDT
jgi:hypothetical protein